MAAIPVAYLVAASIATSVATAGISMQQQKYNAEAQQEMQEQNNAAIDRAAIAQYGDLSAAEDSIQEQAALEGLEQQKAAIQAKGRVNVLAASSGTYGGSIDSMLRDITATRGQNLSTIAKNRSTQLKEVKLQAEQIRYGAAASKSNRVFSKPSSGEMVASVGLAGLQAGLSSYAAFSGGAPANTGGVKGG